VKGKLVGNKRVFNHKNVQPLAGNGSMTEPAKDEEDLEPGEIAVGDEPEAADDPDERSVFVKNVDFSVSEEILTEHFKECGQIER
jgi:RNA recognition motif-containing protein